jgi:mevalonate kinase
MKMLKAFSPGKVLVSGEHSAVYGEPAIVAGLDFGVTVVVNPGKTNAHNPIIAKALEVSGVPAEKVQLDIDSKLPMGSGMGSSAAVAAAVIKALYQFTNEKIDNEKLFDLVMECERVAHGNPSGVDPAAVVYGGLIWYTKGKPIERFEVKKPRDILLIDSGGRSETTKEMVEMVAKNRARNKKIIDNLGGVTKKLRTALEKDDSLLDAVNENGKLLEKLGVVSESTVGLIKQLRSIGAGVKISGAGGVKTGSGILLVVSPDLDTIQEFAKSKQLSFWRTTIGSN